ncbi:MAG: hypothetical protein KatS3mg113_0893 [Planctomycetaceae bacterium]|nr:MAG: hypothetical protein KatS3mg113_0893 [Planctomycetaceae bacterium]
MEVPVQQAQGFVDRRQRSSDSSYQGVERRQFTSSHLDMSPEVAELAQAVDRYKLLHRRRFITYEELYRVITELGYRKDNPTGTTQP